MVPATARPLGDRGFPTLSRPPARNASSSPREPVRSHGGTMRSTNVMNTCLHAVERGIAPARAHELIVRAVLDHPAAFDGDDPVGHAHCREAMRNDQHGATCRDLLHV